MASSLSAEQELLNKAVKQEKSASGGFSFFGGRTDKYERAVELYREAGNAYRVKLHQLPEGDGRVLAAEQGGSAFEAAARICMENLNEPLDAVNEYLVAWKLYSEFLYEKAPPVMEQALAKMKTMGRWRPAAQNSEALAKFYNEKMHDNAKAIEWYKDCLRCYQQDPAPATENGICQRLAVLQSLEGDYRGAIDNYETAADKAQNSNLLVFNIKNYLFQAGICHLATGDMVATTRAFDEYRAKYNQFASTRECQLLYDLKEAVEQGDQDVFAEKLFQFDQMQKLDKAQTTVLLRVKGAIEEKDEDFS